ncbi:MAG: hypothetical protein QT03_C0001G0348 [archaeon GW2011_AR10]|uniref:NOG1 N-terminal helical domain-containing protein n=1 Tax=Candidatus Iainarchaeum sp. TaxID=3101447 RepID=A0A7J4IVP0_9ARCH|nr:MAG: hypothetical protein QT03_C0001G0348 [archaeon GW2011_AR10]HIH07787.1 hypothetical protein [Candidatus Diapherotrites archaeon]
MPPFGRRKPTKLTDFETRKRRLLSICPEIVPEMQRAEMILHKTWFFFDDIFKKEIVKAHHLREKGGKKMPVDKNARIRAMKAKEVLETSITPLIVGLSNMEASILEKREKLLGNPQRVKETKARVKKFTAKAVEVVRDLQHLYPELSKELKSYPELSKELKQH